MKSIRVFFLILLLVFHALTAVASNIDMSSVASSLPHPVLMLFRWPAKTNLTGNLLVGSKDLIALAPRQQSWEWINKVFDTSWLPSPNTPMYLLRKEFDGIDVTRIEWLSGEYRIEVSQTASIFALKITPNGSSHFGIDSTQRFDIARQLCRQIFSRKGRMWGQDPQGVGTPIEVSELNEKITEFSFDSTNMKELQDDKVVIGWAKSMKEEGIKPLSSPQGGGWAVLSPNIQSRGSWCYWFRNVNWWNDGNAVGFYFLKVDGPGPWSPSFDGSLDKNWFDVPRDRLGRPITTKPR